VAHQYEIEISLEFGHQGIKDVNDSSAGVTEYSVHPLFLEGTEEDLRTAYFHCIYDRVSVRAF